MYTISLHCLHIKLVLSSKGDSDGDLHNSDSSVLAEMNTFLFIIHQSHHPFIDCKGGFYPFWKKDKRKEIHNALFKDIIGCDVKKIIRSH